ncbi:MAG: hypothetical protein WAR37_02560 [Candidatus Microsaccharimonas sp.]
MPKVVRIYKGPENTNIIGFKANSIPDEANFSGFLEGEGYTVERLDRNTDHHQRILTKAGSISVVNYGIEPPLSDEGIKKLSDWCGVHVNGGHDVGFVIDNRETDNSYIGDYGTTATITNVVEYF